jgi:phosphoenolpyruvate-protein kinase (PTS system EI component)
MKLYRSFAIAGLITAMLSPAAFAHGFRGHRGGSAMMPCMAVAQPQQKANLKKMFADSKQTLKTDRQNVKTARNALNEAILSGSKNVAAQEGALSKAQLQMLHDRDMLATQFCGQLSSSQLNAASTLYKNMRKLHEQSHAQAKSYLEAAKSAGSSAPTTQKSE